MATVTQAKITAEEFLKMDLGEGLHELVKGEIVFMPPPGAEHGFVCLNAGSIFREYGRRTGHGFALGNDTAVTIDDETVRGADVQYYSEARWSRDRIGKERAPVPPDLVVEVRSPSDRMPNVLAKITDYLRVGVAVVLLIQPTRRAITVYRGDDDPITLAESDILENIPELPDFRCVVGDFFA